MYIKEIGEKAGINHEKLGRIMRLLATKHIFQEGDEPQEMSFRHVNVRFKVTTNHFANSRLSLQLLSSNPIAGLVSFWITSDSPTLTMWSLIYWPIQHRANS